MDNAASASGAISPVGYPDRGEAHLPQPHHPHSDAPALPLRSDGQGVGGISVEGTATEPGGVRPRPEALQESSPSHSVLRRGAHGVGEEGDPGKRGSAGMVDNSGEGGSQEQLYVSVVRAAHQLRGTEDYCPKGIQGLLEAQGVAVTLEQVTTSLEVMKNYAILGMAQGARAHGAAGQTSASQPQDLRGYFTRESSTGNNTTGTSGGTGKVNDGAMECVLNEDGIDKFFRY